MSETQVFMHAHRCMACSDRGEESIWIHPDTCAGNVAKHKCPKCGQVEWKQFMMETAKLPQIVANAKNNQSRLDMVIGYVLFAVLLAALGYCAFLYVKKLREGNAELPSGQV
jgi:RecJ-like exonuclease